MAEMQRLGRRTAEFIVSEGNAFYPRDNAEIDASAGKLEAGTILGQITATGVYVQHASGAADGSEVASAILLETIEEGETDSRTVISRSAEVEKAALIYEDGADEDAIDAELADAGIIVRN